MALIVEDGTIVANANSYISLVFYRAFALARGVVVSPVDAVAEVQLIKAMDYLESLGNNYKGTRVSPTQGLQWPRKNVLMYENIDYNLETVIPIQLKNAQAQLAIEAIASDLMPTQSGRGVIREKVGPIETEYSSSLRTLGQPYFPLVDAWLSAILDFSNQFSLFSYRV